MSFGSRASLDGQHTPWLCAGLTLELDLLSGEPLLHRARDNLLLLREDLLLDGLLIFLPVAVGKGECVRNCLTVKLCEGVEGLLHVILLSLLLRGLLGSLRGSKALGLGLLLPVVGRRFVVRPQHLLDVTCS